MLKQHVYARHVVLEQRYPHTWPRVRSRITILQPGTLDEVLQNMTNEIVSGTVEDADLADQLPEYNGWHAVYEYPGYIHYSHSKSEIFISVCSDFNKEETLDIQVQSYDGHNVDEDYMLLDGMPSWPREGRTAEKAFALIKPFLDKYQPEEG